MLIHASDHRRYLVSPLDLHAPVVAPRVQDHLPAFKQLLKWMDEWICQPHAQLGRDGPVCPYVSTAIEKRLFWLTAYPGAHPPIEEVVAVGITYRDWFLALEPLQGGDAQYKTILILFPDMQEHDAPAIIDPAQILLKPGFVDQGLMIGQFHAFSNEPGIWNPAFRPLRSPIPLLAIRSMVPHDLPFLTQQEQYLRAYLKVYSYRVPRRLQSLAQEAAHRYGFSAPLSDEAGEDETHHALERPAR